MLETDTKGAKIAIASQFWQMPNLFGNAILNSMLKSCNADASIIAASLFQVKHSKKERCNVETDVFWSKTFFYFHNP